MDCLYKKSPHTVLNPFISKQGQPTNHKTGGLFKIYDKQSVPQKAG